MTNNTQRSVDDLTWAKQVFEKLDDDKRYAVRLLILSERQEADKLRQEINELKEIRANALKFLDTELCEKHFEEAKKQSFDDFNKSQKDAGCRLCLRQENEALKAQVSGLVSALTNCIQCTCTPQLANRHNHQYGCCVLIADKAISTLPSTFLEIQKAKDTCIYLLERMEELHTSELYRDTVRIAIRTLQQAQEKP